MASSNLTLNISKKLTCSFIRPEYFCELIFKKSNNYLNSMQCDFDDHNIRGLPLSVIYTLPDAATDCLLLTFFNFDLSLRDVLEGCIESG